MTKADVFLILAGYIIAIGYFCNMIREALT